MDSPPGEIVKKKPIVKKEILEAIEDDVQVRLDRLFDRLTLFVKKEASLMKEEELRAVCVDYAHVDASVVQGIYDKLMAGAFAEENTRYYLNVWRKSLTRD